MLEEASRIRPSTCLRGARGRGKAGSHRLERYLRARKVVRAPGQRRSAGCSPHGRCPLAEARLPAACRSPERHRGGQCRERRSVGLAGRPHLSTKPAPGRAAALPSRTEETAQVHLSACAPLLFLLGKSPPPRRSAAQEGNSGGSAGWWGEPAGGKQIKGSASTPLRAPSRPVSTLSLALMVSFFEEEKNKRGR